MKLMDDYYARGELHNEELNNTTIMTYGQKSTFLIDNNSGFRVII